MIQHQKGPTISRIAPTPSGFLHLGNIVNFILTWTLTKRLNGQLNLRIDDCDSSRVRPEYLEDIYDVLAWLKFDFASGPSSPDDFYKNHSQQNKKEQYFEFAQSLGEAYACECSRKDVATLGTASTYAETCLNKNLKLAAQKTCLRIHIPRDTTVSIENKKVLLKKEIGDFILWRKDDMASYQIASVVDDEVMKTNLIVRGDDLLTSTAAQVFLADRLNFKHFQGCQFYHHPLLTEAGRKLSKSDGSLSLRAMRERGATRLEIFAMVGSFISPTAPPPKQLNDFLEEPFLSGISPTKAALETEKQK